MSSVTLTINLGGSSTEVLTETVGAGEQTSDAIRKMQTRGNDYFTKAILSSSGLTSKDLAEDEATYGEETEDLDDSNNDNETTTKSIHNTNDVTMTDASDASSSAGQQQQQQQQQHQVGASHRLSTSPEKDSESKRPRTS